MKKKILIVDDDPGIGDMLKMLLEMEGYAVTVSNKPRETETNIQEKKIDLVILDMLISGVNGLDVCTGIRKNAAIAETPVLMMSALHDAGGKCKAAGANDFISKPFEMEDLLAKVREVMNS